jgi:hypothetical protein
MGHELFANMRAGDWYLEYARDRLKYFDELTPTFNLIDEMIRYVKKLPPAFKPKYGSRIIEKIYYAAIYDLMNNKITDSFMRENNDPFIKKLALTIL